MNLAYAKGDEAQLRSILEEYDCDPDAVLGDDVGAELVRAIRRISLAHARVKKIEAEISELKASELYKLKTTIEEGKRNGDDILGDLVMSLMQRVQAKREYLRSL